MAPVTPAQLRGARAMLGWSILDLAKAAQVSVSTVKRMEMAGRQPVTLDMRSCVRSVLEQAGVFFVNDDGGGAGVRLRQL